MRATEPSFITKLKAFATVQRWHIEEIPPGVIACRVVMVLKGSVNPDSLLPIIRVTVGEVVKPHGQVQAKVSSVQFYGTAGNLADYYVWWRTPPQPMQTVLPKLIIPTRLSLEALDLLEALYDGATFHVTWRYQSPRPELNGEPMPSSWWSAWTKELEQRGEADFFDGFRWMKSRCALHPYTEEYGVESEEEYVVVGHRLNEAGRKFVEANRRAVTP